MLITGSLIIPNSFFLNLDEKVAALGAILIAVVQIWFGTLAMKIFQDTAPEKVNS